MRKKILAAIASVVLLLGMTLNVSAAATTLPISKTNSYIWSVQGGGLTNMSYLTPRITK